MKNITYIKGGHMSENKTKKVAIVTGGARGIGLSIVDNLINAGYRVAITYKESEEKAMEMVKEYNKDGKLNAIALEVDVRDQSSIKNAVMKVKEVYGVVDVLVNNAGVAEYSLLIDTESIGWNNVINTNLNSVYCFCREVVPIMLADGGSIVNISSMWGIYGASCETAYSAAKAGVIGFTKALAKELGGNNIRVNAVAPGVIATDMCKDLDKETIQSLINKTALGRIGTPQEVADVVEFLAGDKSSFVTGVVIEVSGSFGF